MSVIKQKIVLLFKEPVTVESELFSGSDRNVVFLMDALETSIEMSPDVTLQRPPRVDDVSPIVVGNKWEGIDIVLERESMLQGGVVVKPKKISETVKEELHVQGFDEIVIEEIKVRPAR